MRTRIVRHAFYLTHCINDKFTARSDGDPQLSPQTVQESYAGCLSGVLRLAAQARSTLRRAGALSGSLALSAKSRHTWASLL